MLDGSEWDRLLNAIEGTSKSMEKELSIAVNKTAKAAVTQAAREVRKKVVMKQADAKKGISQTLKASVGKGKQKAAITIKHDKRMPLKYFGAKQTNRGVSYRIDKTGRRKTIRSAFIGKGRLNGHVFVREGKPRLPINKKFGVSAWGAFTKGKAYRPTVKFIQARLKTEVERRIEFNVLKRQRLI